jgi:hypothetical protein
MTGPDINRPRPGSNSIGQFQIGVSPIGPIPSFDIWSTIISQYANSPTITQLCQDIEDSIDPSTDFDSLYDSMWNIDTATKYGLDVWGRILGVTRVLSVPTGNQFLGFQQGQPGSFPFGSGTFYAGSGVTNNFSLSDDSYRVLLFAKALANITDGSTYAINTILKNLFPDRGNCYIVDELNMTMQYKFEFALSPVELAIVGNSGVLPRPPGISATIVIQGF